MPLLNSCNRTGEGLAKVVKYPEVLGTLFGSYWHLCSAEGDTGMCCILCFCGLVMELESEGTLRLQEAFTELLLTSSCSSVVTKTVGSKGKRVESVL